MDDLISRQAVVDLIMETDLWWFEGKTMEILRGIKKLPAIDPVKHAKWELVDEAEPRRYGCSLCKRLSFYMTHSCPHCGAAMDGGENETD